MNKQKIFTDFVDKIRYLKKRNDFVKIASYCDQVLSALDERLVTIPDLAMTAKKEMVEANKHLVLTKPITVYSEPVRFYDGTGWDNHFHDINFKQSDNPPFNGCF